MPRKVVSPPPFRRPRRPTPAADYRVQTRYIGMLNPYPRPCRQPPQHHLLRLQRQPYRHDLSLSQTSERSKGMVDISDSRGYFFFKDKETTICHENSSY